MLVHVLLSDLLLAPTALTAQMSPWSQTDAGGASGVERPKDLSNLGRIPNLSQLPVFSPPGDIQGDNIYFIGLF